MPKMHINKSIKINASAEKVFEVVSDFNKWTVWSPWLIMDPNAKVDVAADARSYSWEGKRVGSGNMKIVDSKKNEQVTYDLNFLKPWKSYAKVGFDIKESNDGTSVAWSMDSSLPFFMFWMKKSMEAFVGADYDRGLALLKDYVEDGEVHSALDFKGMENFGGCQYVGIKTDSTIASVGPDMERDFTALKEFFSDHSSLISGKDFSIYHKWDIVKGKVSYTAGVPVHSVPSDIPANMVTGTIPQTKVHTVAHTGPYEHLGNAWSAQYNIERSKEFKLNKKIHPFETYLNDPADVAANELVTEIHFPAK
ncbi:MAG: SRPBCC family protein [Bacteroidota bacterium]